MIQAVPEIQGRIRVNRDACTGEFWSHLQRGAFPLQVCRSCGHIQYYPRVMCRQCQSPDLTFMLHEGTGVVISCTLMPGDATRAHSGSCIALLRLDGITDTLILSEVVTPPDTAVEIGSRVVLVAPVVPGSGRHKFAVHRNGLDGELDD